MSSSTSTTALVEARAGVGIVPARRSPAGYRTTEIPGSKVTPGMVLIGVADAAYVVAVTEVTFPGRRHVALRFADGTNVGCGLDITRPVTVATALDTPRGGVA